MVDGLTSSKLYPKLEIVNAVLGDGLVSIKQLDLMSIPPTSGPLSLRSSTGKEIEDCQTLIRKKKYLVYSSYLG